MTFARILDLSRPSDAREYITAFRAEQLDKHGLDYQGATIEGRDIELDWMSDDDAVAIAAEFALVVNEDVGRMSLN